MGYNGIWWDYVWLVVTKTWLFIFSIWIGNGMSSSQLTKSNLFQRGRVQTTNQQKSVIWEGVFVGVFISSVGIRDGIRRIRRNLEVGGLSQAQSRTQIQGMRATPKFWGVELLQPKVGRWRPSYHSKSIWQGFCNVKSTVFFKLTTEKAA